jgi:CDP-diacylglycerol--serine O-phosphatidyltransferase
MKHLPNLLTLMNAALGCVALYFVADLQLSSAMYCVLLAAFFDLFDGLLARRLGVSGALGMQLDSLADLISFGVVPGAVATTLLSMSGLDNHAILLGFAITLGAVYRLAVFNTKKDKEDHFKGLPTPANALFWIGLPLLTTEISYWELLVMIMVSTYMLNSSLLFLRIKIRKHTGSNIGLIIAVLGTIVIFLIFGWAALTPVVAAYLVVSILFTVYKKLKS